MKILIIDDEPDLASLLANVIEKNFKISTVTAESKSQAIKILTEDSDIAGVISDFQLPDGTGGDLLKFIQSSQLNIPILICSGTVIETIPEFKKNPAAGYLLKPFTKKEVLAKIENVFGSIFRQLPF